MPRLSFRVFSSMQALFHVKMLLMRLIGWAARSRFQSWIRSLPGLRFSCRQLHGGGNSYSHWLEVNRWNERRANALRQAWLEVAEPPQLSVILPVCNPDAPYLQRALASVGAQIYPHWELCLVHDRDAAPEIVGIIEAWQNREPRLQVKPSQNPGVSGAANTAAAMARYDHLVLMSQVDELAPEALAEVALGLAGHPRPDVVYSDHDRIDAAGRRFDPNFKPDWSPELLLASMYLGPLLALRRDLYHAVGEMRPGFGDSRDYDLALRVTEQTSQVCHLPKILYHWRVAPGATGTSGHEPPQAWEAGRRALQEALARRGLNAVVRRPPWANGAADGIYTHEFPHTGPRVAIIIPTRNQLKLLQACINSLAKTRYQNYRVYIIDNDSDDPDTLDYLRRLPHTVLRLSCPGGKFNFSYLINRAAERTSEEYLLLLNNDVEVVSPAWLSQMVGYLGIPGVGAVGARLLFPDGRVQHAGVLHGVHLGKPGHAFRLMSGRKEGYQGYAKVTRNYGALTAACMLTSRRLFQQSGGFEENHFGIAYNDVDYCYRLVDAGYRMVYCPSAELVHHEGVSRGTEDHLPEVAAFVQKYRHRQEPYYNPNLCLGSVDCSIGARTRAPARHRPIRVLMCTPNLDATDAPQFLLELAGGLRRRGIITPIIHSPADGPLRPAFEAADIPVWLSSLPLPPVGDLKNDDRVIDALAREIAPLDSELIFGNTLRAYYGITAAAHLNLPCLWHIHEGDLEEQLFGSPRVAVRQVIKGFAFPYQVIFSSDSSRILYGAFNGHNNFMTLPDGLDSEGFARLLQPWSRDAARGALGLRPDDIMVLLPGTICETGGQMDVLKAIRVIDEECLPRVKFFLVGDRPNAYSRRLHAFLASLDHKRRNRLSMVPETEDRGLYYRAADIFLCTSRIERIPRPILEAMYCRLPIITTPLFGASELLRYRQSARFYNPGAYGRLAGLLETLIREPTRRRQLGDNAALALAALPDYDDMLSSYAELFREAFLSGQPRTGRRVSCLRPPSGTGAAGAPAATPAAASGRQGLTGD
jgi:GT2 family glycosyltransferase/glycosyltransferase involved in cell wall biosynthesis